MITFYTIPKPFRGHIGIIQRNAIRSWTLLKPKAEIILFGNEEGIEEIARELGIRHVPEIAMNEHGTPLVNDVFEKAEQYASFNVLCYINTDIIVTNDFMKAISFVASRKRPYVLGGQRWNLDINRILDFDTAWENTLRSEVGEIGKLEGPTGIDYFVFPRHTWGNIPPFAVGRTVYDNWLIYRARSMGYPVINATDVIFIVHQNHDYAHVRTGDPWSEPEAARNVELAGGYDHAFDLGDSTHRITPKGIRPALGWKYLERRIKRFPVLHPRRKFISKIIKSILWRLRKRQRRIDALP